MWAARCRTKQDAGWVYTLEITRYDKGMWMIKASPTEKPDAGRGVDGLLQDIVECIVSIQSEQPVESGSLRILVRDPEGRTLIDRQPA